ncbi:flavohemoglobin expression-modulating QEGLA motif protein [bacterium]|nr:flavohemoglobin expression-modulating QEGLA motif protein [bacterium]
MKDNVLNKDSLLELLKDCSDAFSLASRKGKLLATLAWGPQVAQDFFKKNGTALPRPTYEIDRKSISEALEALGKLHGRLQGEHPVLQWLMKSKDSFSGGLRLILAIESPAFFELSNQLYGASTSRLARGKTSNLDLARSISGRMGVCNLNDIAEAREKISAEELAAALEKRLRKRNPPLHVKIELTDTIVSKVIAGMSRVRIRKDARFSDMEQGALWNHEVESHCLTAQNGALQRNCPFLAAGGPRTTLTQEGIAVFHEIYSHTMSQSRFLTLCDRVEAVHKVEEGADFLELYRWFLERSDTPLDAFYASQRIFRGAPLGGRYPFTKDVVYLAGLLEVYHFLQAATKVQDRMLIECLLTGRLALEDVGTIEWLRMHGILEPPHFVPEWLRNWESLVSFFSFFGVVLHSLDLSSFQTYFDDFRSVHDWKMPK